MIDIDILKDKIVNQLKPIDAKQIILFGSYAYGIPNEDSDLDLCIIKEKIDSKRRERREIRQYLNFIDAPMDILLVDEEYYKTHNDKNWINTALYEVHKKGEILYEKR